MFTKTESNITYFQADQNGINELKNDFFREAKDFVYFRKGEWTGFEESLKFAIEFLRENPQWIPISYAGYKLTKEFIIHLAQSSKQTLDNINSFFREKPKDEKTYVTVRVICGEQEGLDKKILEWDQEVCKDSIVVIPEVQVGQFRYLLNEQRYALFSRLGHESLQGLIGNDKATLNMFRNNFDREFIIKHVTTA